MRYLSLWLVKTFRKIFVDDFSLKILKGILQRLFQKKNRLSFFVFQTLVVTPIEKLRNMAFETNVKQILETFN